ncbi:MAG: cytochrome b [Pseudomonadota bacterium]
MSTQADRYTAVAIALHWIIAAMILGQIIGGMYMAGLPLGSEKFELYQAHKSFGITVLFLSLVRLAWRLAHRPPPLPDGMENWERMAARASHIVFYALMIGVPLGGWAVVSASPLAESVPTLLFGVIPWPHLPFFAGFENREGIAEALAGMHGLAGISILGLLLVHVGAALQHHLIKQDDVLARMLPFLRKSS